MRRITFFAATITPLFFMPSMVHSQTPDSLPTMVPAEFVELLWGPTMLGGRTELLVGRLPDELAATVDFGSTERVIGSVRSRLVTIGAAVTAGGREVVQDAWDAKLRVAGWTPHVSELPEQRGFATEQAVGRGNGNAYCSSADRMLTLTTRGHRGDSTVVMLALTGEIGTTPCTRDVATSREMVLGESPVPILRAPVEAQQRGSGGGGGGYEWDSHARLRTELAPGALLGHYGTQLLEQGWLPITQSIADDVAIHVSRKTDDEGEAWQAVLYVTVRPDGERDLYLRVTGGRR
jgi:hypothetical protein